MQGYLDMLSKQLVSHSIFIQLRVINDIAIQISHGSRIKYNR